MKINLHLFSWIPVSMLLLASYGSTAQCNPPSALWLNSTQTSTAFTLSWPSVSGAAQYQIRYWENAAPNDKTIVDDFGAPPSTLSGLKKNTSYTIQIRSKCGNTVSGWSTTVSYLTGSHTVSCSLPSGMNISTGASSIHVGWTSSGSHTVRYRLGSTGDWLIPAGGLSVSNAAFSITGLSPGSYQVEVKQNCSGTPGNYLGATATIQEAVSSCLSNKDYGKNLTMNDVLQINYNFNTPSPHTFADMIGVNDGGLTFRSFQNATNNQITRLTTQYRNFHTMDEDFDSSLGSYAQNIKPKQTSPEGTPANTAHNKGFYNLYRNTHGFTNITGAVELLHYSPHSWKDKIFKESDWSNAGPAGIMASFENYCKKFIDEFAPANGSDNQMLVSNFQVGNELWDYPVKTDYHSLLYGARNAFISKYGQKNGGGWKMKLVAGSFQAFRDNYCSEAQRDASNCGAALERHDFIGDYLNVSDCNLLKDLDAIDCHPYSFLPGTTSWTYPENPNSEAWQIRNLAGWLAENKNAATGVLGNTLLWSSEYGFDSNPVTGVGEKTQSAYLIRGLLMHSRYHFAKVYFYNAFDHVRTGDANYEGLYQSSGFWKLGTQPANSMWPSPLQEHGAVPKPSWFAMLDMKNQFGDRVFYKALAEEPDAYVWLIAKPDGSDPCLVFWSPQQTNDGNVNQHIPVSKIIDWSGVLDRSYRISTSSGQTFADSETSGQVFTAATGSACGTTTLTTIRRNPAFIRLEACSTCSNITHPGSIIDPNPSSGVSPFNPGAITNDFAASGGTGGSIVYQWQQSPFNNSFNDIAGATSLNYDPPSLTQSTFFRRAARRSTCTDYLYSPSVVISVTGGCPIISSFQRRPNTKPGCNVGNDYYFEIVLGNVSTNDQVTLAGLPINGLSITSSTLNGAPFNASSFHANLQYLSNNSFRWLVNPGNGGTQILRLYYCWANSYPNPVSASTASSLCSGVSRPCSVSSSINESDSEERGFEQPEQPQQSFGFEVHPNPATDQIRLTYYGSPATQANLRIIATTGQLVSNLQLTDLENQKQWQIATEDLPPGIYFLYLQVDDEVKHQIWGKL